jgi:hypothetical protein
VIVACQTFDDVIPNPEGLRNWALSTPLSTIKGPDGELYSNVAKFDGNTSEYFGEVLAALLGRPVRMDYCGIRFDYAGEMHDIHADSAYSEYAFVLYLNPPDQCRGGTAFWRNKKYGWCALPTEKDVRRMGKSPQRVLKDLCDQAADELNWEKVHMADMKTNRLITYPTTQFHSRWPLEGFGSTPDDGRLVAVGFYTVL